MHLALGQLRLEGATFFRSEFTEGFAIESEICDVASWLHAGETNHPVPHRGGGVVLAIGRRGASLGPRGGRDRRALCRLDQR